jgi:hypothetical protein
LSDDVVCRMDGADLRFMDESSGMLPSPSNESPGSNVPVHRPNSKSENNSIATNPSLLQKALLQATTQSKQPSPTVLMKSNEMRQCLSPAEKNSNHHSPPAEPQINKFSTEVSVTNHNDNKPVTTIINKVSNLDGNKEGRDEIEKVPTDVAANTNAPSTIKVDETNKLMPKVDQNDKSNKERKTFLQNLRKRFRLDGKKKPVPLLGFVGNRQKSHNFIYSRCFCKLLAYIS